MKAIFLKSFVVNLLIFNSLAVFAHIINPRTGATVNGTINISSDQGGGTEIYVDDSFVGYTTGYDYVYNTLLLGNSAHQIYDCYYKSQNSTNCSYQSVWVSDLVWVRNMVWVSNWVYTTSETWVSDWVWVSDWKCDATDADGNCTDYVDNGEYVDQGGYVTTGTWVDEGYYEDDGSYQDLGGYQNIWTCQPTTNSVYTCDAPIYVTVDNPIPSNDTLDLACPPNVGFSADENSAESVSCTTLVGGQVTNLQWKAKVGQDSKTAFSPWVACNNMSSCDWKKVPAGTYQVQVFGTNSAGRPISSKIATIIVAQQLKDFLTISCDPGIVVNGPAKCRASYAGNNLTSGYWTIKNDKGFSAKVCTNEAECDFPSVPAGTYELTGTATDIYGNTVKSNLLTEVVK